MKSGLIFTQESCRKDWNTGRLNTIQITHLSWKRLPRSTWINSAQKDIIRV